MLPDPLREACFEEDPIVLGPMAGATFRWSPRRLGMALSRYKHTAKLLSGLRSVAEIGCADGFCSRVVSQEVIHLHLFDSDPGWIREAKQVAGDFAKSIEGCDISRRTLPQRFDGIYLLDVIEHIAPEEELYTLKNIADSLQDHGVCVIGTPSIESQQYARVLSREGHVNCKSGEDWRKVLQGFFRRVFVFGMNDEMIHTGFLPMCHYLLFLCVTPIRSPLVSVRRDDPLSHVPVWDGRLPKKE